MNPGICISERLAFVALLLLAGTGGARFLLRLRAAGRAGRAAASRDTPTDHSDDERP